MGGKKNNERKEKEKDREEINGRLFEPLENFACFFADGKLIEVQ